MPNITPRRLLMVELAMEVDAEVRTPKSRQLVEEVNLCATSLEQIESQARHFRLTRRMENAPGRNFTR
jgi:hypothetical protein